MSDEQSLIDVLSLGVGVRLSAEQAAKMASLLEELRELRKIEEAAQRVARSRERADIQDALQRLRYVLGIGLKSQSVAKPAWPNKGDSSDDLFLRDTQVAERYSVHRNTIHRWAKEGVLPPPVLVGNSRRWRLSDLAEYEQRI